MPLKKPYWHRIILICIVISLCNTAEAKDSTHFKNRKQLLIGSNLIGYSSLMVGLNELWYKDYPTSKFHFFNDNQQWLQMDKIGHAFSCYYEGLAGIRMMKWAGFNHKQSTIIGGSYGLFVQTGIEVLDGFSEAWGASSGDMIANISGTALVVIKVYIGMNKNYSSNTPIHLPNIQTLDQNYWVALSLNRSSKIIMVKRIG